ncbi:hypothetical protein DPSP01_008569 [Paraphaeosphaeria sporulosa]
MNREVVWPEDAVGKEGAPPEGMSPEEWYAEVRQQEMELAIAAGLDEEVGILEEAEGRYTEKV